MKRLFRAINVSNTITVELTLIQMPCLYIITMQQNSMAREQPEQCNDFTRADRADEVYFNLAAINLVHRLPSCSWTGQERLQEKDKFWTNVIPAVA